MNDVFVRHRQDLPYSMRGLVLLDENGDYNIYVNPHLSVVEQNKAIKHEMAHIRNGDFSNDLSVEDVEERAKQK